MSEEEDFVRGLLEGEGYKVSRGYGYDFNAERDDSKLAVEVKSTDISKPYGKIVIDWSQIEALIRAVKKGRKSYLVFITRGEEEPDIAIFGLVACWSWLDNEQFSNKQPVEPPPLF